VAFRRVDVLKYLVLATCNGCFLVASPAVSKPRVPSFVALSTLRFESLSCGYAGAGTIRVPNLVAIVLQR